MIFAFGAKSLRRPVTRSSKRMPTPMSRSASLIAMLFQYMPCIPGMPRYSGCVPGKPLMPRRVVITGMLAFSASSLTSAKA